MTTPLTWNYLNETIFDNADLSCFYGYTPMTVPEEDPDGNLPSWDGSWSMIVASEQDGAKIYEEISVLGSSKMRFFRHRVLSSTEAAKFEP